MALITETGAGVEGAESYASVADANAYFSARNNAVWDAADSTDAKEPALRKATQYLDAAYRFRGDRTHYGQALCWPRASVVIDGIYLDQSAIPQRIKDACCELALRALSADLFSDVAAQHVTDVAVGPIKRSMSAPSNAGQVRYAVVDSLIRPLVRGGGSFEVVRA